MKMQLMVATAIAAALVMGVPDKLSAQDVPVAEDQAVQAAKDADDVAKVEDKEEEGEDKKKKDEDKDEDEDGEEDKKKDEKDAKAHKGKGKADGPIVIINIYINGQTVVEGHVKQKQKD